MKICERMRQKLETRYDVSGDWLVKTRKRCLRSMLHHPTRAATPSITRTSCTLLVPALSATTIPEHSIASSWGPLCTSRSTTLSQSLSPSWWPVMSWRSSKGTTPSTSGERHATSTSQIKATGMSKAWLSCVTFNARSVCNKHSLLHYFIYNKN